MKVTSDMASNDTVRTPARSDRNYLIAANTVILIAAGNVGLGIAAAISATVASYAAGCSIGVVLGIAICAWLAACSR